MCGRRRDKSRAGAAKERGQALVEFSMVAPLFFFLLFFALSSGFYTLERAAAVNATTAGARIAAGAQATNLNQPALAAAQDETARLLQSAMPGTRVVLAGAAVEACPALESIPPATVMVCASSPRPGVAMVEVAGHPAGIAAPAAGGLALPLYIYAEVHTVVFRR